jgi:uncharacterized RmlC-like cupin family protein
VRLNSRPYSFLSISQKENENARQLKVRLEAQWRKVIPGDSLDRNTAQTAGMIRAAAVNFGRVGARMLWAGTVTIEPDKTGAHHHGPLESVIYVLRGRARMRSGAHLEYIAEAAAGDFIYIPPYVPDQEINASTSGPLECVIVRSENDAIVVNLQIQPADNPKTVVWVDDIHKPSQAAAL